MVPLFTLVTTQGSVVTSDGLQSNRALWRIRVRTTIKGNIAASKETTLLKTALGVGIIVRPRAIIPPTTWSRNKMADKFQRGEKLIFWCKIHLRRGRIVELGSQVAGRAVPVRFLTGG